MPSSGEFSLGYGWNRDASRLVSGGTEQPRAPWDDGFAGRVFRGEVTFTAGGFFQLAVLKGSLGAPVAVAMFQDAGHTVKVEFLDGQFRPELSFLFVDARLGPEDMFLHDDGIQRPGDLLLRSVTKTSWTGELGPAGVEKRKTVTRQQSNLGLTRVGPAVIEPEDRVPENDWHTDPDVNVSVDGFWEPVATFGDWDRWFVRDRPGVKLFD